MLIERIANFCAMSKDALAQAATNGDLEGLRTAIKQSSRTSTSAQVALVCAVKADQLEAVKMLLDWGAPVESADDSRRRALHLACTNGSSEVVQELVKHGADVKVADHEGTKPLDIAVAKKHLQCCKVLLKAGAQLNQGQQCKGLAAIVQEVQLEVIVSELKGFTENTPDVASELLEADGVVWKAQQEQMRLMALKEEQKAGKTVIELERHLELETEVYSKVKRSEDALSREITDLRVNVQTVETTVALMRQQLDTAEAAARHTTEEEVQADIEYRAMMGEMSKFQSEKEESDKANAAKEKAREDAIALLQTHQETVNAMKLRNRDISEELKAESAALRGWERDKEAAAALTAQAQRVLRVGT